MKLEKQTTSYIILSIELVFCLFSGPGCVAPSGLSMWVGEELVCLGLYPLEAAASAKASAMATASRADGLRPWLCICRAISPQRSRTLQGLYMNNRGWRR
jgi:hypothetical protein